MVFFKGRSLMLALCLILMAPLVQAAPYAALVMDARTGKVLHSRNADTRLHPASLTKMMTLYVAFEAIERGEIRLDSKVKISKRASQRPPSKLGLRAGQTIEFKYLIRAAAVKSANDAATAIAEAVSGSEAAFAKRMTATAKAMGMTRTSFRNAHGLTQKGHMSTARDMANLGRRLFFDHRDYYNLFSRTSTHAGTKQVYNTNRRFLRAYRGADGIKTGFTNAAGYNLVGSARRGNERIIASLFGGKSVNWRNARMAELLDMGFARAPSRANTIPPSPLGYVGNPKLAAAAAKKPRRLSTTLKKVLRPVGRPTGPGEAVSTNVDELIARAIVDGEITAAVEETVRNAATLPLKTSGWMVKRPPARRDNIGAQKPKQVASLEPPKRNQLDVMPSGAKNWSVHLGTYGNRNEAERLLLQTALKDLTALEGAYRKIETTHEKGRRVYRARFVGLTQTDAERACARLTARSETCVTLSPGT